MKFPNCPPRPWIRKQRRTDAFVDVVDAAAVELEKAPARRIGDFDLPGGIGGESGKSANDDREKEKDDGERRHVAAVRCLSVARWLTGESRSTIAIILASLPTSTRLERR